jgi:hypothetical protein
MSAVLLQMVPRKPGRRQINDARNFLRLLPRDAAHGVGLYAVGFVDGRIKLGRSKTPRQRVLAYWHQTAGGVAWAHYFGCASVDWGGKCRAEVEACGLAAVIGKRIDRSEYFTGLTKAQAISIGRKARADDIARRAAAAAEA